MTRKLKTGDRGDEAKRPSQSSPYPAGDQIALAKKRLGKTQGELLAWVTRFADRDLDRDRPEELQALGYDLLVLPLLMSDPPKDPLKWIRVYFGTSSPLTPEQIRTVQREVAAGLKALFAGKDWHIPAVRKFIFRCSHPTERKIRFGIGWDYEQDETDLIISAIADLVLIEGPVAKLRACLYCGKVFVANRRQRFCSPGHSQLARDQRKKAPGSRGAPATGGTTNGKSAAKGTQT